MSSFFIQLKLDLQLIQFQVLNKDKHLYLLNLAVKLIIISFHSFETGIASTISIFK